MSSLVYERITARIIALLEQGTVPWHRSWDASTGWPSNLISKNRYRGINVFLLLTMEYKSPFWLTIRQVSQLGGQVRKGEKSCLVVFWKMMQKENAEREIPHLRYYCVFNVAQCDGLDVKSESQNNAAKAVAV